MGRATQRQPVGAVAPRRALRGFTLIELMVVITLIGILAAMAAPRFGKAVQQVKNNVAVTNLKAIWAAERYYWIYNINNTNPHTFADLHTLQSQNLVDSTLSSGNGPYTYNIVLSNFDTEFTAKATLNGGTTGFMISQNVINSQNLANSQSGQVTDLDGNAVPLPY